MKNTSPPRFAARIPAATGVVVGAALLAIWPVLVALARHDGSPVGADTPVYVWWARLVGAAGASAVGMRPGVPDAVAVVSAALGIPTTVTVSALGCALVAMVGLAGCAVLRAGGVGGRTPAIGLVLAGLFSTYLASGHLSNACFAALFVLALAFVLDGELAGMTSAVALVGAAGLSHPDFLLVATPILVVAAALAMAVHARRDAVALGVTAAGGVVVTGLGLLAASTGGRALDVPTSLDVFLAQTHQTARLQALFLERFRPKVASYAMWAWIPLAALATRRLRTPLGRLLIAWVAVTVVGVAAGLLWQPYPPHRIVAFAFCLPLLAAIGLHVIDERLPRAGLPITIAAIACIGVSVLWSWVEAPRPFDDPLAAATRVAAERIATAPGGTVVVDIPAGANATAVSVIRVTNLLRAAVPTYRIDDVIVRFPAPDASNGDAVGLWRDAEGRIAAALAGGTVSEVSLGDPLGVAPVPGAVQLPPADPALAPPAPTVATLAAAVVGWLVVCGVAGTGWCVAAGQRGVRLLERSVGVGFAGLILVATAVDRAGGRLGDRATAVAVVMAVALTGGLAAGITARRRRPSSPPGMRRAATTTHRRATHPSAASLEV